MSTHELNFSSSDFGNLAKLNLNLIQLTNQLCDLQLTEIITSLQERHPNPFCRFGRKGFSQTDEDGLTFEIIRRIGINSGNFIEFGVGNGTENNTLALLGANWRGVWAGGEELSFSTNKTDRLYFSKERITKSNILNIYDNGLEKLGVENIDLISLDLDGNDFFFVEKLLTSKIQPKIFIVEYNAKFPPPMRFSINYDENHVWDGTDYYGASLCTFNDLFEKFDYFPVCCNAATGANAFFVKREYREKFQEVPNDIESIYAEPNFNLYKSFGHRISTRTIETLIGED